MEVYLSLTRLLPQYTLHLFIDSLLVVFAAPSFGYFFGRYVWRPLNRIQLNPFYWHQRAEEWRHMYEGKEAAINALWRHLERSRRARLTLKRKAR